MHTSSSREEEKRTTKVRRKKGKMCFIVTQEEQGWRPCLHACLCISVHHSTRCPTSAAKLGMLADGRMFVRYLLSDRCDANTGRVDSASSPSSQPSSASDNECTGLVELAARSAAALMTSAIHAVLGLVLREGEELAELSLLPPLVVATPDDS